MPVVSRFGAVPEVSDDPDALYREAARELLRSLDADAPWTPALERLLLHLDNEHGRVEELIVRMLARRDQWLRHVVRVGAAAGDDRAADDAAARAELERGLAGAVVDALARARSLMGDELHAEIVALARSAAAHLIDAGDAGDITACAGLASLEHETTTALAAWRGVASLLLTAGDAWRASVSKAIGFPPKDAFKARMQDLLAALSCGEYEDLRAALAAVRRLPPASYSDEQWATIGALVEVLKAAAGFLATAFQLNGATDFTGIAIAARTALGVEGEPTDLALGLDYQIRHLLVDEFQDTSHGQFELLERLTAGWTAGDGRTVFAVGDPMQSIYRFREAEVGLFLQAQRGGIGAIRLEPLTLSVNFRSQRAIVDWVNEAFATIFPSADDIGSGAVRYTPSAPRREALAGEAVAVVPGIGKDFDEEAAQIAGIIRREREASADASIAILVRSRAHLEMVVDRLRRDGIRFQAVEIDRLRDRPVVGDLLALTRALVHPADRIAWLAVLRVPWCGLELADLAALTDGSPDSAILELLADRRRLAWLCDAARARVERLLAVVADDAAERRRRSLRRTVEGAWLALGGPACAASEPELHDAYRFFDLLDAHDEGGDVLDVALLEKDVDDLYASPDMAERGLQIMTVHKAKGLEFDVVILPGLGRGTQHDAAELLLFTERPHERRVDLLLAPIKASDAEDDPVYRFLRELEKQKRDHENRRLLYVAATRARDRLYLLGNAEIASPMKPATGSLLAHLWPMVSRHFEELRLRMIDGEGDGAGTTAAAMPRPASRAERRGLVRLAATWQPPAAPSDVVWERSGLEVAGVDAEDDRRSRTWAEATTRHIGTAVHRLLCRIARDGAETWSPERVESRSGAVRSILAGLGIGDEELDRATRIVIDAAVSTLRDERGRWILSAAHEAAGNELGLTGVVGGELRSVKIDRTFVDADGTRWIVDYKAGYHESVADRESYLDMEMRNYRGQLDLYAELLGALEPGRTIRRALYFPRLGGWREIA
jgi:ATP-dependent exoDNAse (exonuclease V) beta subunit